MDRYVLSREKESNIKGNIEAYQDAGLTREEIERKIIEKYQLSPEEVAEKLDLYWV